MKAAICFFGITRNLEQHTLGSIQKFLELPVAKKDPDYRKFGHFNALLRTSNPRTGEENLIASQEEYQLLNCHVSRFAAEEPSEVMHHFKAIKKFGDAWSDGFISLRNLIRQLYSLDQVTQLLLGAGRHFDVVIYSRADVRFEREVKIPKVRSRTLYTPYFGRNRGLNDRFALGSMEAMTAYGQRYKRIYEYCQETGQSLHAEKFLKWSALKAGLADVSLTSTEFRRIRAHGLVAPRDLNLRPLRIRRLYSIVRNSLARESC
jgi:hypothetical protein